MHWIALESPHEPTDALARRALGWWALQFTPYVAWVDEALLLEVQSCLRLWGGQRSLLQQIYASNPALARVKIAQAATSLIALARLRCRCADLAVPKLVDDLPLPFLSAAQPHWHTLSRLGLQTWGQLRALPRAGVARRFGAPLLAALDAAYGQAPEAYAWLQSPDVFDEKLELSHLQDNAIALMPAANALLHALQAWLQARTQGVLAFELIAHLDVRKINGVTSAATHSLPIRTAQATQAREHLARLLAEHLTRTELPAPVHSLSLRSLETALLPARNHSLLAGTHAQGAAQDGQDAQGESLQELLERLHARLGAGAVLQAKPQQDHRPEHMTVWVEAQDATKLIAAYAINTPVRGQKGLKNRQKKPSGSSNSTNSSTNSSNMSSGISGTLDALHEAELASASKSAPAALPLPTHAPQLLTWPTWLLRQPLLLPMRHNRPQYQGALRLLAGPQRLEAGWWGPGQQLGEGESATDLAARDYFIAHSPQAGLVWVYRERLPKRTAALSEAGHQDKRYDGHKGEPEDKHESVNLEPPTARWFLHGVYS
jgi:protein ImuB